MDVAFDRNKRGYDLRVKETHFAPGDFVWFYNPRNRPGRNRKWLLKSTGPHLIVLRVNLVNFLMRFTPSGRAITVHVDRIQPYLGKVSVQWEQARQNLLASLGGDPTPVTPPVVARSASPPEALAPVAAEPRGAGPSDTVATGLATAVEPPAARDAGQPRHPSTTVVERRYGVKLTPPPKKTRLGTAEGAGRVTPPEETPSRVVSQVAPTLTPQLLPAGQQRVDESQSLDGTRAGVPVAGAVESDSESEWVDDRPDEPRPQRQVRRPARYCRLRVKLPRPSAGKLAGQPKLAGPKALLGGHESCAQQPEAAAISCVDKWQDRSIADLRSVSLFDHEIFDTAGKKMFLSSKVNEVVVQPHDAISVSDAGVPGPDLEVNLADLFEVASTGQSSPVVGDLADPAVDSAGHTEPVGGSICTIATMSVGVSSVERPVDLPRKGEFSTPVRLFPPVSPESILADFDPDYREVEFTPPEIVYTKEVTNVRYEAYIPNPRHPVSWPPWRPDISDDQFAENAIYMCATCRTLFNPFVSIAPYLYYAGTRFDDIYRAALAAGECLPCPEPVAVFAGSLLPARSFADKGAHPSYPHEFVGSSEEQVRRHLHNRLGPMVKEIRLIDDPFQDPLPTNVRLSVLRCSAMAEAATGGDGDRRDSSPEEGDSRRRSWGSRVDLRGGGEEEPMEEGEDASAPGIPIPPRVVWTADTPQFRKAACELQRGGKPWICPWQGCDKCGWPYTRWENFQVHLSAHHLAASRQEGQFFRIGDREVREQKFLQRWRKRTPGERKADKAKGLLTFEQYVTQCERHGMPAWEPTARSHRQGALAVPPQPSSPPRGGAPCRRAEASPREGASVQVRPLAPAVIAWRTLSASSAGGVCDPVLSAGGDSGAVVAGISASTVVSPVVGTSAASSTVLPKSAAAVRVEPVAVGTASVHGAITTPGSSSPQPSTRPGGGVIPAYGPSTPAELSALLPPDFTIGRIAAIVGRRFDRAPASLVAVLEAEAIAAGQPVFSPLQRAVVASAVYAAYAAQGQLAMAFTSLTRGTVDSGIWGPRFQGAMTGYVDRMYRFGGVVPGEYSPILLGNVHPYVPGTPADQPYVFGPRAPTYRGPFSMPIAEVPEEVRRQWEARQRQRAVEAFMSAPVAVSGSPAASTAVPSTPVVLPAVSAAEGEDLQDSRVSSACPSPEPPFIELGLPEEFAAAAADRTSTVSPPTSSILDLQVNTNALSSVVLNRCVQVLQQSGSGVTTRQRDDQVQTSMDGSRVSPVSSTGTSCVDEDGSASLDSEVAAIMEAPHISSRDALSTLQRASELLPELAAIFATASDSLIEGENSSASQ